MKPAPEQPFALTPPLRWGGLAFVAAVVFLISYNYGMYIFYVKTTAILDSGWFAGLVSGNDWRLINPISVGGENNEGTKSAYEVHVSLFLVPITYLSRLLSLPPADYLVIFLGSGFAIYAGLLYLAIVDSLTDARLPTAAVIGGAVFAAIVLAFNGVSTEIIAYAHPEIWIPVFICAFLYALAKQRQFLAAACLVALLSVREDAGFHLVVILAAIIAGRQLAGGRSREAQFNCLREQKNILLWAAAAFAYSILVINVAGMEARRPAGIGEEFFTRLFSIFTREDWAPAFIVLAVWAALTRRPSLLLGFASCLPWILYSATQKDILPSYLSIYYGFPFLVAFFWPFVCLHYFPIQTPPPRKTVAKKSRKPTGGDRRMRLTAGICAIAFAASTLLFRTADTIVYGDLNVGLRKTALSELVIAGLSFPVSGGLRASVRRLRDFYLDRRDDFIIVADDGFTALHPHDVPHSLLLSHGPPGSLEQDDADILIVHLTWALSLAKNVYALRAAFDLAHVYRMQHTDFLLFSKEPLCGEEGGCLDDLPLEPLPSRDESFERQAAEMLSFTGFTFPATGIMAAGGEKKDGYVVAEAPAKVIELNNLPLAAGRATFVIEYMHQIDDVRSSPRLELSWQGGGDAVDLPLLKKGEKVSVARTFNIPRFASVNSRIIHRGGGELRIYSLSVQPKR